MRDKQDDDRAQAQRDPEQLQREADAIRADLDRTLEALEHKLSPRRIANRSVDMFRRNGSNILYKAGETAVRHPIAALLTSAGLIWLARSKRKTSSSVARDGANSSLWSKRSTSQSSADAMRAAGKFARRTTRETQSRLGRVIRDRPVLCGTVAAALGAAVSAAVPATHYEREAVERARHSTGPLLQRAARVIQGLKAQGN